MQDRNPNPELKYLLHLVENHYGSKLTTTKDFELLSDRIEKETGELLSPSTLKRLYGYVSLSTVPRKSTLDILALYIGKKNYYSFCTDLRNDPAVTSAFFSTKTVYSSSLRKGDLVRIGWTPCRLVTLEYLGNDRFEVTSSVNASLRAGDRFEQVSFMLGYPLYISRIFRDGDYTPAYVAGKKDGLNQIEVITGRD
ncbi:MAG: hypothetical protein ACI399_06625 [Candidatus Cryptobacteroides sp.]